LLSRSGCITRCRESWKRSGQRRDFQADAEDNLKNLDLEADVRFIHDPQPAGLIRSRKDAVPGWIWRCPYRSVRAGAGRMGIYRAVCRETRPQRVFRAANSVADTPDNDYSSIDALSDKNRELDQNEIEAVRHRIGLRSDKPIVAQISSFDRLKDPLGVIAAWKLARGNVGLPS
jgi:trehalose synthase